MFPLLLEDKELLWDLAMTQFYLPDNVILPKSVHQTKSLSEEDAEFVYFRIFGILVRNFKTNLLF